MSTDFKWTNSSVAAFAAGNDPVKEMERRARHVALSAIDNGWTGPPFDPLALSGQLGIELEARSDIADARIVPAAKQRFRIEYNPLRPRGRLRFSIAHEIAHTLFSDCAEAVRNRGPAHGTGVDDWQLEVLCNIGAAELLMPLGSFTALSGKELTIENVLQLRREFDVSIEACLLRLVKLADHPVAAFCASLHKGGRYKLDYVIPTSGWRPSSSVGFQLPAETVVADVSAIGFTSIGAEVWGGQRVHVECVGLAPYPGQLVPRVVGLIRPTSAVGFEQPKLKELKGDALSPPNREGTRIIAHVVPNTVSAWGGGGFASQVRKRYPDVWITYRFGVSGRDGGPRLGTTVAVEGGPGLVFAQMIAQQGIGPSPLQRLKYSALAECLAEVRQLARARDASVHMPRVGTGHGGADWNVVRDLILTELVEKGVDTTIYELPRRKAA